MYQFLGSLFSDYIYQIERVIAIEKSGICKAVSHNPATQIFSYKFYFIVAKNKTDNVTEYFLVLRGEKIDWYNVYQIMRSFGLISDEIEEVIPLEKCIAIVKHGTWKVRTKISFLPETPYTYKTIFEIR